MPKKRKKISLLERIYKEIYGEYLVQKYAWKYTAIPDIKKLLNKVGEKAKHLYSKKHYINSIVKLAIAPFRLAYKQVIENETFIKEYAKYFGTLGVYIFFYGVLIGGGISILTSHYMSNPVPFNLRWIYVCGLGSYLIKEELTRIIRSCFPVRSNAIHE